MKYSLAVALLVGATQAVKLRFAEGLDGNEDLGIEINMNTGIYGQPQEKNTQQSFAQAAAKAGSGVRAKWVELPTCPLGQLGADVVPLKDDLSNAIIATCKGYQPGVPAPAEGPDTSVPPNMPADPTAGNDQVADPRPHTH